MKSQSLILFQTSYAYLSIWHLGLSITFTIYLSKLLESNKILRIMQSAVGQSLKSYLKGEFINENKITYLGI